MGEDYSPEAFEKVILQVSLAERQRLKGELDEYQLSVPQYVVLRALAHVQGGLSMSELAEAAGQVSATMTGIIDRLSERGLVERKPHPSDRRALQVSLTAPGETLLAQIGRKKRLRLQHVLKAIPEADRRQLLHLLHLYLNIILNEAAHK